MKDWAIGIDFGTTNSLVSEYGSDNLSLGTPRPFTNSQERPHPSVVWYPDTGRTVVGLEAKKNLALEQNPFAGDFFKSIKRKLGKNEEMNLSTGQRLPAWKVASEIFMHLNQDYKEVLKREISEAVVTIPVDFDGRGRKDIAMAMHAAGIEVSSFVHEPFAALISHFYSYENKLSLLKDKRVMVFDWGGGTLDICIAEVSDDGKKIYELANAGVADRAGDEFDLHIMQQMISGFINNESDVDNHFTPKPHERQRLLEVCEIGKIGLSKKEEVNLLLPGFCQFNEKVYDIDSGIQRGDFEKWISTELLAAEKCVDRTLEKARLMPGQIDHVLMVGGTSNIPAVASTLASIFGPSKVVMSKEPDKAISYGAAIVAAEGWKLYNVNDICVKLADDSYFPILKAGTELNPKNSSQFTFNCVDSRNKEAHLFFEQRKLKGDDDFSQLGNLSVPSRSPHDAKYENLDRIQGRFSISDVGTLICQASSSSIGQQVECEIHDLATGILLD
jgi:molecular chaperone DnaK (HSP70)